MAITNTTTPDALHAAFNDVDYVCTSDRYDATPNGQTATTHADSGGVILVTIVGHGFLSNDIITGAGFSDSDLNVVATATYVSVDTFTLNITWEAGFATDKGGTWTRTNDDFQMKCEVKVSATVIATKYTEPDASDDFNFEISGILQSELSETILALASTALTTDNSDSVVKYTLTFTEQFNNASGLRTDRDTLDVSTISGNDIIAFNNVIQTGESFSDYNCSSPTPANFLTSLPEKYYIELGAYLQLSFITDETAVYCTVKKFLRAGGDTTERIPAAGTVTVTNARCILPLPTSVLVNATYSYVEIRAYDSDDNIISEVKTINLLNKTLCNEATLMFKNHQGAFDTYTFVERKKVNNPKRKYYVTSDIEKTLSVSQSEIWELGGRPTNNDILGWLQDLYNSKVIYWIDGTDLRRVNVVDASKPTESTKAEIPTLTIMVQPQKLN